jgi:hypothetical protein
MRRNYIELERLKEIRSFNPLNAELNPIRHLLALVGAAILSTLAG